MYMTINVNHLKRHFNIFYMYVHSILHVFTYNGVVFTALC